MNNSMTGTVLVTGANRGIGLEFVKQYAHAGSMVYATCRNPDRATELQDVVARAEGRVRSLQLDVADGQSISALQKELRDTPVDLLINNAGIYGPRGGQLGELDEDAWLEVFRVNAIAPLQVTAALLANLDAGRGKKVIAISSRMGSIADNTSGGAYLYRSSKAALNAALRSAAIDLRERGICVAILHPGWVATDMGGPQAMIDPERSVTGMRSVIDGLSMQQSGDFFSYDGSSIGW